MLEVRRILEERVRVSEIIHMQDGFLFREPFLDANEIVHREFPLLAGLLDRARVIDQMNFRVRAFDQHVAFSRLFIFGVEKDAAGYTLELAERRDLERKPLVGKQCAMRREHLLPVATLLQGAEYFFKVRLHAPLVRRDELREAHCLKVHESRGKVFLELLGRIQTGTRRRD